MIGLNENRISKGSRRRRRRSLLVFVGPILNPTVKLLRSPALLLLSVLWIGLSSESIYAQSLSIGYQKYKRGDFRGAESALTAAAKTSLGTKQKALVYKYLGISQYMLGKKSNATQVFKAALQLDPSLEIKTTEVLDEGVIQVFDSLKPKTAAVAATKGTHLKIESNVASATVLVDGIIAGNVGRILDVQEGIIEVQLNAKGYISKRAKVKIYANRLNNIRLDLEKPKPKPKPKPPPAATSPSSTSVATRSPAAAGDQAPGFLPVPKEEQLFDSAPPIAPAQTPSYLAPQPTMPAPAPVYPQPYIAPQPMYQPVPAYPTYPTMPYAPVYPVAPQPIMPYSPQPYAAQPMLPPDPMQAYPAPVSPGPVASQPSIDSYPPPPAVAFSEDESVFDNEEFLPTKKKKSVGKRKSSKSTPKPVPFGSSVGKKSKNKSRAKKNRPRSRASSDPNMQVFFALLPFGSGQFYNQNYLLGTAFLGAEAAAIYFYLDNKQKADQAASDGEAFLANASVSEAEKEEYAQQVQTYIAERRQYQNYALYGFFGLWAAGSAEAIFNAPSTRGPKKRYRKRRVSEDSDYSIYVAQLDQSISEDEYLDLQRISSPLTSNWPKINLGLLPAFDRSAALHGLTLGAQIKWEL